MPACLDCGRSAGHFDGCPQGDCVSLAGPADTQDDALPICGPERLGDSLDRISQQVAERCRDA